MTQPVETADQQPTATDLVSAAPIVHFVRCTECEVEQPHGYIQNEELFCPAILFSLRAGTALTDRMVGAGRMTAENQGAILAEIRAAGLPDEVENDVATMEASLRDAQEPDPMEDFLSGLAESLGGNVQVIRL